MNYTRTEKRLMEAMAETDVIDAHEHLPPESIRTDSPQDVFTLLSTYINGDLFSAGMDRESFCSFPPNDKRKKYESLFDYDIPLAERWETFRPYWQRVRYGSYARAAFLAAKMVYGVDDINDETYQLLSERIAAENTPGIYRRILCDTCRIRVALTQCYRTDVEPPLVPLMWGNDVTQFRTRDILEEASAAVGVTVRSLDDCLLLVQKQLDQWVREGIVGVKLHAKVNPPPDARAAEESLSKVIGGRELVWDGLYEPLDNFLMHHLIDMAAERQLVVAVHAGMWGDFRHADCKHLSTLASAHPKANFDLYHLGMPFVRDAIVVAKNWPNVFLNLCWTHIISQVQTCSGIDELLDQVPVNKVLGFGGDYDRPVENVVGHLHMAREDFARVFGARIDRDVMGFDEAVEILNFWFWDNPLALYARVSV